MRVSASDEDADNNGAIVYTLSAPYNPNDLEYFEIQPESGWIVLKKPLDVSKSFVSNFLSLTNFLLPIATKTIVIILLLLIKIERKISKENFFNYKTFEN